MKQLTIKATCFTVLAAAVFFTSCDKDPQDKLQPGNPQTVKELRVSLPGAYLPVAKVDSALAIWEVNGATQTVKLQVAEGGLKTSLAHFTNQGTGTLRVQLFSQLKVEDQPLQWEYSTTHRLDYNTTVLLTGPAALTDPAWNPRVIFNYDNFMGSRFKAIVALRPGDPYFELKGVEPVYARKIEIVRSFHNKATGAMVFSRGWVCENAACLDQNWSLVNRQHFTGLDEQLQGRQWDQFRIEATFHLNSTPASAIGFGLMQDKMQ